MLIYFAHLEFKKKIVFADKGLPVGVYFGCLMLGTTAVESLCWVVGLYLSPAPAAAPQNTSSTTLNATTILVQWEEVPEIDRNGIITFYEVRVDPTQFQDVSYFNVSGSELVLVVDGLEEFVEYSFTIRAYTIAGPGPFSDVTANTTDEASE